MAFSIVIITYFEIFVKLKGIVAHLIFSHNDGEYSTIKLPARHKPAKVSIMPVKKDVKCLPNEL